MLAKFRYWRILEARVILIVMNIRNYSPNHPPSTGAPLHSADSPGARDASSSDAVAAAFRALGHPQRLAIVQLLPPFPGVPWGRHLLAVPLIALGAVLSVASYLEWTRNQRALRRGEPLPRSPLPRILAAFITAIAVAAAALVLLAPGPGG